MIVPMKLTMISCRVPADLLKRLRIIAAQEDIKIQGIFRQALELWVTKREKQRAA